MQLMTFHRVLIGSAIAVFLAYSAHQLFYAAAGGAMPILRSALSLMGAICLVAYLRWMGRRRSPRR